jgi:DNA-binding CsgD family transcriptional regulator/PAS domain-containing protein
MGLALEDRGGIAMGDDLLSTIESIYAAGLNAELWPQALASVTQLIGGVGTTMETIDRRSLAHLEFFSFGVPPANEIAYLDHYASRSPRIQTALPLRAGELVWEYHFLNEREIDQSAFYGEFLASMDLRYSICGLLKGKHSELSAFAVQRSARHGHVDHAEIALMEQLTPHVSQAMDMTRRLRSERTENQSLEHALDWLADGIALIRADGSIAYANGSFQAIARAGDGLRITKNALEFTFAAARSRFDAAIAGILALRGGVVHASGADFAVARPSAAPPYVFSVRPLLSRNQRASRPAVAIVYIRNPSNQGSDDVALLRELFGLTNAEAGVALALRQGISLGDYGRSQGVSQNTVYTHLRRIREKTGCHRLPELIGKLNDVRTLLRRSYANGAASVSIYSRHRSDAGPPCSIRVRRAP